MRIVEIATQLKTDKLQVEQACTVLGLQVDSKGNIDNNSSILKGRIDVWAIFTSLQEQLQKVNSEGNNYTLVDIAQLMVDSYTGPQQATTKPQATTTERFTLDKHFEETYGVKPADLVEGSRLHLLYEKLKRERGTGIYLLGETYRMWLAEAEAAQEGRLDFEIEEGDDEKKRELAALASEDMEYLGGIIQTAITETPLAFGRRLITGSVTNSVKQISGSPTN
jgi:hypothetical protein